MAEINEIAAPSSVN